jgi:hypothetical protein
MLRDRGWPQSYAGHNMTDTHFFCPDRQKDFDAGWLTNDLKETRELVFGSYIPLNIQIHACILTTFYEQYNHKRKPNFVALGFFKQKSAR